MICEIADDLTLSELNEFYEENKDKIRGIEVC